VYDWTSEEGVDERGNVGLNEEEEYFFVRNREECGSYYGGLRI